MSEQLKQIEVRKIGKYNYYSLGSTTLGQLKSEGIISSTYNLEKKFLFIEKRELVDSYYDEFKKIIKVYSGKEDSPFVYEFSSLTSEEEIKIKSFLDKHRAKYRITKIANNKPDSLIMLGKKVVAYIEWKDKLKNEFLDLKYINQKSCIAKELTNLLILTDSEKSLWINVYNKQSILDERDLKVNLQFNNLLIESEPTKLENILDKINSSITKKNNNLSVERTVLDPSDLADTLWQKIYSATGKDPQKCLYNVVELVLFKYLSDVSILPTNCNFEKVYELSKTDDREALRYYADNSRKKLREKFPNSKFDDTTIINGVIFINERNEPSLDQSVLFKLCLRDIKDYEKKNGKLDNISKNFKTKLYETFLRPYLRGMGQYFTPRKIIQTMINMSEVANLKINKNSEVKIIDPFCGVGGFINEIINLNPEFEKIFSTDSHSNKLELKGYDKGSSDRDSERTIILAKANLLIYLSDIFSKHLEITEIVSQRINDIFRLHRTNLGTLGIINKENRYNFIFTNPPYLSSGIKPIIEEIKLLEAKTEKNKKFYTVHCGSLEAYCLQWIVKSLAPSGKGYVILPNSVFKGSKSRDIREFIRTNCFIEAIIKLPNKTFYTTNDKKTYILILEKKCNITEKQNSYIFTYLLSNIGEKLNSKTRESISANDCPELEILFSSFSKSKIKSSKELNFFASYFSQEKLRKLKLLPPSFLDKEEWIIDLEYDQSLLIELGFSPEENNVSLDDFCLRIEKAQEKIKQIKNNIEDLKSEILKNLSLASEEKDFWECVYEHGKGNSKLTKKYIRRNKGNYPVYSSAFKNPELGRINDYDIDCECIQLIKNADAGRVIYRSRQKMSYNGDCWMLSIREEYEEKLLLKYVYYYLKYCLQIHKKYDWNYKITKKNFLLVFKPKIKFPPLDNQKRMITLWDQVEEKECNLNILINGLKNIKEIFVI